MHFQKEGGDEMTRKKKQSRKYMPRNEFRYNNSPSSRGHLQYIFGETRGGKYKSFGFTHQASDAEKKIQFQNNPNPQDNRPSFMRTKVVTAQKRWFTNPPVAGLSLGTEERAIVRFFRKRYNKSLNRHPPGYYEQKKKKK